MDDPRQSSRDRAEWSERATGEENQGAIGKARRIVTQPHDPAEGRGNNAAAEADAMPEASSESIELGSYFPEVEARLRDYLRARNVTTAELVKQTGMSRPTLARLIRGKGNPLLVNYAKLAEVLGTSLWYLLGPQSAGRRAEPKTQALAGALLSTPPRGDPRALEIYNAVCSLRPADEIDKLIGRNNYALRDEIPQEAVTRAILDVYDYQLAWIDEASLPRNEEIERALHSKYKLRNRAELENQCAVRVVDLPETLHHVVQIHALAAVAASVVRRLLGRYSVLGFSDGFAVSAVQKFIPRGTLTKAELIPLTYTPKFVHYEMSGATLVGSMGRRHQGYRVRSSIDLSSLNSRLKEVRIAITACGAVPFPEPYSRLARLIRETQTKRTYESWIAELKKKKVIGDLMYHFLLSDGKDIPIPAISKSLETISVAELESSSASPRAPAVYAASPDFLATTAERGVCLLLVHSRERARVAHAALVRKSINFLVISRSAAEKLLTLR